MSDKNRLYPLFLGPYGENNELFEKLLLEFLRDHVYWRRNFHPEDPPVIPTLAANLPEYRETVSHMAAELHQLSAALKRSVPFSSPRYIGHMTSELLMPALIAQIMTLPYNPNNVVDEAAPVTMDMEISVGLQLARMIGFTSDESSRQCAFGHVTSGGTVANYEALNVQRALRHYPLAVAGGLRALKLDLQLPSGCNMTACDDWQLGNFDTDNVLVLHEQVLQMAADLPGPGGRQLLDAINAERIETLGWSEFSRRHPDWREPVVLVPTTAHYSWQKGVKLIGLGSRQLTEVPEIGMRMNSSALEEILRKLNAARIPVLAIVAVLGTTEFGTLDPVHEIVAVRNKLRALGLFAPVHVDAAWGGYLTSLFRNADGEFADHDAVRKPFKYFPSRGVYDSFRALPQADSVTIDPHKLGFVPFGAGAVVFRDQRMLDLVSLRADYVFDPERNAPGYREKFRQLGRYILEGSKSGAAAAAVYVSQRVLPPHRDGLGRVIRETIHATEYLYDRIAQLAETIASDATLLIPVEPDSNLLCLAMNPAGNTSLSEANRFTRAVFAAMKVDAGLPVQSREFFGSCTSLSRHSMGNEPFRRLLQRLGIIDDNQQHSIFILRHTLMNPWLQGNDNGINYLDAYGDFLVRTVRRVRQQFAGS